MKWREKLNKMALIDILYMLNKNSDEQGFGVCIHDLVTGTVCECKKNCKKCMESLLNEEVKGG